MPDTNFIAADLSLARRLEKTEALANVDFVKARKLAFPDSDADWTQLAGAYAMFDGPTSPLTQTFALGIFEPFSTEDLEAIETFFTSRNAQVFHEVSPLVDQSLIQLLNERAYQPVEFTNLLFRPLSRGVSFASPRNEGIKIRIVDSEECELWTQTAAQGWGEFPELAGFIEGLAKTTSMNVNSLSFLAELESVPIATGAMSIQEGVALLAGASTIPSARKQGAQLALLDARLRYGVEHGCDIAAMGALPGSASQRNAERQGFRIAYTRIKWHRPIA